VAQERTGILRHLSAKKNLAFRRQMVGRVLPSVTLEQSGIALTSNFLNVEMNQPRKPNENVSLLIGDITAAGLRERESDDKKS
jgi:hypothetical protein